MQSEWNGSGSSPIVGCAMAQAVSTMASHLQAQVHDQDSPCGICGGQSGAGTGFCPTSSVHPSMSFHCGYIIWEWTIGHSSEISHSINVNKSNTAKQQFWMHITPSHLASLRSVSVLPHFSLIVHGNMITFPSICSWLKLVNSSDLLQD
jgi:hypothetical protein